MGPRLLELGFSPLTCISELNLTLQQFHLDGFGVAASFSGPSFKSSLEKWCILVS